MYHLFEVSRGLAPTSLVLRFILLRLLTLAVVGWERHWWGYLLAGRVLLALATLEEMVEERCSERAWSGEESFVAAV